MKTLARIFQWLVKAAIFFTLFAFALNNQNDVTVHFFFGRQWTTPLVLVVLAAFSMGLFVGVLGMIPRWLQQHKKAANATNAAQTTTQAPVSTLTEVSNGI